jgi:hypothetical protein
MTSLLEFKLRSGGKIIINLDQCNKCDTKACIDICKIQEGPLVLDDQQVPSLRWPLSEVERGGCVECLGCELNCNLYGLHAVTIQLPIEGLDQYIKTRSRNMVYQLKG